MNTGKVFSYGLIGLAAVFSLVATTMYFDLKLKEYFLPKEQEVEREAWEESQSFQKGAMKDIRKHRRRYLELKKEAAKAPDGSEEKNIAQRQMHAIRASVRQRASDLDKKDLKDYPKVRKFVEKVRNWPPEED